MDNSTINELGITIIRYAGIPYTTWRVICMGRCSFCRDPNKDQKIIRKRRKEEFKLELNKKFNQLNCESCPDLHIIDYDDAFCYICYR